MNMNTKKAILIVDDSTVDAMIREALVKKAIDGLGVSEKYEVVLAGDKETAQTLIKERGKSIAAIILDNDFPERTNGGHNNSGLKLLSELRRQRNSTPVLWNSGNWGDSGQQVADTVSRLQEVVKRPERMLSIPDRPDFVQIDKNTYALNKGTPDASEHIVSFVTETVQRMENKAPRLA